MAKVTIEVEDTAAVIVLNEDDENQLFIPNNAHPDDEVPDHIVMAAAISLKLQDVEFIEELFETFSNSGGTITNHTLN